MFNDLDNFDESGYLSIYKNNEKNRLVYRSVVDKKLLNLANLFQAGAHIILMFH